MYDAMTVISIEESLRLRHDGQGYMSYWYLNIKNSINVGFDLINPFLCRLGNQPRECSSPAEVCLFG
jgi:hypothetical protein